MKIVKLFFVTIFSLLSFASIAQTTILNEGFESGWPSSLSVWNGDGDANAWSLTPYTGYAHTGNAYAGVLYNSSQNNDWLYTTNTYLIPTGYTSNFTFWARSQSATYPEAFQIQITTNGGSTWQQFGSVINNVPATYTQYSCDLSSYAGSYVGIAIVCVSQNQNLFCVDDILWTCNSTTISQTGTISRTIGDYFVSGVSPVNNTITASDPFADKINFYVADPTFTIGYDSLIDYSGGHSSKSWTYDMGSLDTGMVVWALFYNSTGSYYGYNYYYPNMISKPEWLYSNGYVSNVTVVGNTVQMLGHFFFNNQLNPLPGDIPGLGSTPYNIATPEIQFNINYNCGTGLSTASNAKAAYSLNIFDQANYSINQPLNTGSLLTMDGAFNPRIAMEASNSTTPLELKWPLAKWYPLLPSPYPSVKVDGGITLSGSLKGKLIYDYNSYYSAWGIDTAKIIAKMNASAFLRVKADALVASATGTLVARGSIGAGLLYSDFPSPAIDPLFGGELEIAGTIDYKLGAGIFTIAEGHLEKTFYDKSWGNQFKSSQFDQSIWENFDALNNYKQLLQVNQYLETPDFFAQPNMDANDNALYIVWLDYDANYTYIKFSELNYQTGQFSSPQIVTSGSSISNPKISILPSGNALIVWTQNRYNASNFNTSTMDLNDLLEAQDIWATLYDNNSHSFVPAVMISDDNSTLQSGRAEGNASIMMGKGQYGLITWVVNNDQTNENSDVWFAPIAETGITLSIGTPSPLIDLPGINKSVSISYYDSTHAYAVWINDPDGDESTLDNQIVQKSWTQTNLTSGSWSITELLVSNNGSMSFDEVDMDFNGQFGAFASTATEYLTDGDFQKYIFAVAWDPITLDWADSAKRIIDAYHYFVQPRITVNQNGYAALTYQEIDLYSDSLHPDIGVLNLDVCDTYANPDNWNSFTNNPYLFDSAVYDWDLNTCYGNQDNYYIITQEADTITGNAPVNPPNGVRFGSNHLNLVIRALGVNPGAITDIPEPDSESTLSGETFDFRLYPNPVGEFTTIEFSVNDNSHVSIEIFDLSGKSISLLLDEEQSPGTYKLIYEPNSIPNGIYLCKVTIDMMSAIMKMIIVR